MLNGTEAVSVDEVKRVYGEIGYPVIAATKANDEEAVRALEQYFPERLTVFMGQSGAGNRPC